MVQCSRKFTLQSNAVIWIRIGICNYFLIVYIIVLFAILNERAENSCSRKNARNCGRNPQKDTGTLTSARTSPGRPIYFRGITRISDSLIALATCAYAFPSRLISAWCLLCRERQRVAPHRVESSWAAFLVKIHRLLTL